jgi:hypothetical protein
MDLLETLPGSSLQSPSCLSEPRSQPAITSDLTIVGTKTGVFIPVFRVMTPCSLLHGYQRLGETSPSFSVLYTKCTSRDCSVTDYGLDGRVVGVRVPVGAKIYPLHVVQTSSEAYPASYPMGTGALYSGVNPAEHEADHSPPRIHGSMDSLTHTPS